MFPLNNLARKGLMPSKSGFSLDMSNCCVMYVYAYLCNNQPWILQKSCDIRCDEFNAATLTEVREMD